MSVRENRRQRIAIVGTVGVPGRYGGFETLAENLVRYHSSKSLACDLEVYCSGTREGGPEKFLSANLRYIPLKANGAQSVLYDVWSLLLVAWRRCDVVFLCGVSGAALLPVLRAVSKVQIVTNIDGIEWRRAKWNRLAKWFLRCSEYCAARFSHQLICDNEAISAYVRQAYGINSHVIAYGGDHVLGPAIAEAEQLTSQRRYAISICRIEPENNVDMILDAFAEVEGLGLVFVGNWDNSVYGRSLRQKYSTMKGIVMLDSIYDLATLRCLRTNAFAYVHGHSAGGTNPSLVEAMHFGRPIIAFDCSFNRLSTENKALYFSTSSELLARLCELDAHGGVQIGADMLEIARRRYTWEIVAREYFLLASVSWEARGTCDRPTFFGS
jgi:glycosyltransferase involved in cell wall biosynthesis